MQILVLCDYIEKALDFERSFKTLPKISRSYLICNNTTSSSCRYYASQILQFLRGKSPKNWMLFINLLLQRKLKLSPHKLSSQQTISYLKKKQFDVGIHSMGVIYQKAVIETFKQGLLNAHIGKLPEMRGRCVMEWSLLYNIPTGVTSFFIDDGIDTGQRILFFEPCSLPKNGSVDLAKHALFSRDLEIYKKSLLHLCNNLPFKKNTTESGKRYYVMSQFMINIVARKLSPQKP